MAMAANVEHVDLSFNESIFSVYHRYCKLCKHLLVNPHVLSCLHMFCEQCLINLLHVDQSYMKSNYSLVCPECKKTVGFCGIGSLVNSSTISNSNVELCSFDCSSCNVGTSSLYRCRYCSKLLCFNCFNEHNCVICNDNHLNNKQKFNICHDHNKKMKYYCFKCEITACIFCLIANHNGPEHNYDLIVNAEDQVRKDIEKLLSNAKEKISNCNGTISRLLQILKKLQSQHDDAKDKVEENFESVKKFSEKCRSEAFCELDALYLQREIDVRSLLHQVENFITVIGESCKNTKKLLMEADSIELLNLRTLIFTQCTDFDKIPQIGGEILMENGSNETNGMVQDVLNQFHQNISMKQLEFCAFATACRLYPIECEVEEKIPVTVSTPCNDDIIGTFSENGNFDLVGKREASLCMDSDLVLPMIVKYTVGSLGALSAQFNCPHGFCLGVDDELLVADTNNHRIQVFHKNGEFKLQFGIPGRHEGYLWFPRKVAVLKSDKRIIVSDRGVERTRFQIFSQRGIFEKKISFFDVGIVASLCVTNEEQIAIVDSTLPTVYIINEFGDMIRWFDCSSYMIEPSDIVIHGSEIFICDFKGHRVAVFNENGVFQRYIGNKDVTCYPNGIDVSIDGDVFVSNSNNNRFHVAHFNRNGDFKVTYVCQRFKIPRCCGMRLNSNGLIITVSKNNHRMFIMDTTSSKDQMPVKRVILRDNIDKVLS